MGHYQEKAIATYELDELYAFFLDKAYHLSSVYDELDFSSPMSPLDRLTPFVHFLPQRNTSRWSTRG